MEGEKKNAKTPILWLPWRLAYGGERGAPLAAVTEPLAPVTASAHSTETILDPDRLCPACPIPLSLLRTRRDLAARAAGWRQWSFWLRGLVSSRSRRWVRRRETAPGASEPWIEAVCAVSNSVPEIKLKSPCRALRAWEAGRGANQGARKHPCRLPVSFDCAWPDSQRRRPAELFLSLLDRSPDVRGPTVAGLPAQTRNAPKHRTSHRHHTVRSRQHVSSKKNGGLAGHEEPSAPLPKPCRPDSSPLAMYSVLRTP